MLWQTILISQKTIWEDHFCKFIWKNQEDQILAASSKLDLPDCFGKIENKPASWDSGLAGLFSIFQNDLLQGWEFSFWTGSLVLGLMRSLGYLVKFKWHFSWQAQYLVKF